MAFEQIRAAHHRPCLRVLTVLALAGGLISCASQDDGPGAASSSALPRAPSNDTSHSGLHNVHALNDHIISGAVPVGDGAFDELAAMGVRTIISVDGAWPDAQRAQARGLRYVHIPTTYSEVTPEQQMELARAIRDLPGPIYIHCHHGKHRSPSATAAAAVALGIIEPDEGIEFMRRAGTAAHYSGLYACVASARPVDGSVIDAAPSDFPSLRRPTGMVAAMVECDIAYENLLAIRAAGWKTPEDHPDLVPGAEAGRLADHLRFSAEDHEATDLGADFMDRLAASIASASALEESLVRGDPGSKLEEEFKVVQASCRDCHAEYRDRVR
jgi:protein tyrosine phosphatase (PTP) superfamily phosphohydrolase (DUF442 family)